MAALRGSCLCGAVAFEVTGPLAGAVNCHCSICRKAHAAAFRSRAGAKRADFRWRRGEDLVTRYESSPGTTRAFCRICGTRLISEFAGRPDELGLPLAVLDGDPGVRPMAHVHVASKAVWHEIADDLPQFPGGFEDAG